jgi:LemA protein
MKGAELFWNVVLFVAVTALLAYSIVVFNGLVRLRNEIRRAWSNVDVLLKQRADEVPNLVQVVKGYAAHERDVIERVTLARARYLQARSVREVGAADDAVRGAVDGLVAVAEAYPQLKADQQFLRLQRRLSEIEDAIADRRELYNDTVTAYNTRIDTFPDLVYAGLAGMRKPQPLFEAKAAEREVVGFSFG